VITPAQVGVVTTRDEGLCAILPVETVLKLSLIAHFQSALWSTRPQRGLVMSGPRYYWNRGGCTKCRAPGSFELTLLCAESRGDPFIFGPSLLAGPDCACGSASSYELVGEVSPFVHAHVVSLAPPAHRIRSRPEHDATVRPEVNRCASPPHLASGEIIRPSPRPLQSSISFALSPVRPRILLRLSLLLSKPNVYALIATRSSGRDPSSELGSHPLCTFLCGSWPWQF
jgi:hypothetical protein